MPSWFAKLWLRTRQADFGVDVGYHDQIPPPVLSYQEEKAEGGKISMYQNELRWFPQASTPPSDKIRLEALNPNIPGTPYYGFKGNEKVVRRLVRIDFNALGRYNHVTSDLNVALFGPAGVGKTEIARRHNKARGLPFVEITPKSVKMTHDIFNEIARVVKQHGCNLVEQKDSWFFKLPPIDLFVDEVHALPRNIVDGLLKATEHSDKMLVTEKGFTVDCSNVHWIIATTDRGRLADAFDTRFVKLQLRMYTQETVAEIVKANYPLWDMETCRMVAHYSSRVPREALAFAREMELEHNMYSDSWKNIAAKVAVDNDVDEHGMTYQRLAVLRILGQGPVAGSRLPSLMGVQSEEMERFVMPWLMEATEDQEPLVSVCSRGFVLTEAGIAELDKRGIPHKAKEAA